MSALQFGQDVRIPDYTFDEARLDALADLDILDTSAEAGFDSIVELATTICECPVALVSLVDRDRQWFKARVNFPPCETDLNSSVCAYALVEPDMLVIPDLTADPRTAANPLVTGEPFIRFYAGAPLRTPAGHVIGSLCVIDKTPRPAGLTPIQASGLKALALQVENQLALRRAIVARDRMQVEERQARAAIQAQEVYWQGLFNRLNEGFLIGQVIRDDAGRITDWRYLQVNPAWGRLLGLDHVSVIGRTIRELLPDVEDEWITDFAGVVETGQSITFTRQVGQLRRWYEGRGFALEHDRFGVLFLEVTNRIEADRRRAALLQIGDALRDMDAVGDMTRAASEVVGVTLDATRAGFGRLDEKIEFVEIEPDWTMPGMATIAGRHRFEDYGDIRHDLLEGKPLIIEDVTTDPRTRDDPGPMLAVHIAALVNMPVRERGRTVALFIVHDDKPRVWTPEELGFLRNVADRLESAVARLEAQAVQKVLNEELSHRMKNTMAMVQAIAIQTLKDVPDKEAVAAFTDRVHALSTAHGLLMDGSWSEAEIASVVAGVLGNFRLLKRFDIVGPDLRLGPRSVMALSLLLHELTTNAVKYGALSVQDGCVALTWRIEPGPEGDELVVDWIERGGPAATAPTRKGFGSRLINMGLVGSGGVKLDYGTSGFGAEMRALLSHVQQP